MAYSMDLQASAGGRGGNKPGVLGALPESGSAGTARSGPLSQSTPSGQEESEKDGQRHILVYCFHFMNEKTEIRRVKCLLSITQIVKGRNEM